MRRRGEDLVADPFELAVVGPVVAPVGLEARGAADAFEYHNLIEGADEPGDEHGERRGPVVLVRGIVMLERRSDEAHGRDYRRSGSSAGLSNADPPIYSRKWLRSLETRESYAPVLHGAFPTKWGVTPATRMVVACCS